MEGSENGISRRSVLKRIGAGAAIAWVTPVITSMNTPAFARESTVCTNPGSKCFADPDCCCFCTVEGPFFCSNNIYCNDPNAHPCTSTTDCLAGWFCQGGYETHCGGGCGQVCIPGCGVAGLAEGTGPKNR